MAKKSSIENNKRRMKLVKQYAPRRARLKAIEATIPLLEASEKQFGYRLAVLVGVRPGALDEELDAAPVPTYARELPIGDPTQLLRNRPDVRAAERQLAAATARVGVAKFRQSCFVKIMKPFLVVFFNVRKGSDVCHRAYDMREPYFLQKY